MAYTLNLMTLRLRHAGGTVNPSKVLNPRRIILIKTSTATEKQLNKEMLDRIQEVDKMKPDDKKMVFAFLDAFITKSKLKTIL